MTHPRFPCHAEPDLWFPVGYGPAALAQAEMAKALCGPCPIKVACLQTALDRGDLGVWGGTFDYERRVMMRRGERSMDSEEARRVFHHALASA